MLKFLRFGIGGYFGGYDEIRLWVYKHSAKYEVLYISDDLVEATYRALKDYDLQHGVTDYKDPPPEGYGADAPVIPQANKRFPIKNMERLAEWDSLGVDSWDDDYYEPCCDGTQWELRYTEEGKKMRRITGSNAYPPQWKQFIEWLDGLIPEMMFIRNIEEE